MMTFTILIFIIVNTSMMLTEMSNLHLSSSDGLDSSNPYLYPCETDEQCNNTEIQKCATIGPDSSHWFCACYCGAGPCMQNEDCCTNICDNGICSGIGGQQGSVCSGICPYEDQCAPGYICQQWGAFGYCNSNGTIQQSTTELPTATPPATTILPDSGSNPYLFPCTSDDQCLYFNHYCAPGGPNSSYSFCNCACGGLRCSQDGDCCTNICNNGICSSTGGTQGCFCACGYEQQCADDYYCMTWGNYGYCNKMSFDISKKN